VWLYGDAVSLLYGCGYGYGSGAATNTAALILPILKFAIYKLRVMGGYVDIGWVELLELVDVGK
jgi:hypothetical protein